MSLSIYQVCTVCYTLNLMQQWKGGHLLLNWPWADMELNVDLKTFHWQEKLTPTKLAFNDVISKGEHKWTQYEGDGWLAIQRRRRVFLSSLLGLRVWMECLQESCQIFVHDESWAVTYLVEILWICWCVDGGEFPSFSHSRGFSRIWNLEVCASHDLNHQEDLCLFFLPSSFFVFIPLWLKSFSKTCSDVRIYCTWSFSMFSFLFLLVGSHSALISH